MKHLAKLVPEARIGVGHGQMSERQLAHIMFSLPRARLTLLLSTTIIESGLDFPNANTLIVDHAEQFGLSQLYQLARPGGAGVRRAYAYFFHVKWRPRRRRFPGAHGSASPRTRRLGAGYSIHAMRDLEMRGAGELLGTRQTRYIASVGFHLYTRMLSQAVEKLETKM
jgi:transcription-repair coupling factor (superfamily II helicase)